MGSRFAICLICKTFVFLAHMTGGSRLSVLVVRASASIDTDGSMTYSCTVAPPACAWIETCMNSVVAIAINTVAPAEGAWVETNCLALNT